MRYLAISLPTLDSSRLQIVPTTTWRIQELGFNNGVKSVEATNFTKIKGHLPPSHRLTTIVRAHKRSLVTTEPPPHNASNRCWAHKPSLPQVEVSNGLAQSIPAWARLHKWASPTQLIYNWTANYRADLYGPWASPTRLFFTFKIYSLFLCIFNILVTHHYFIAKI